MPERSDISNLSHMLSLLLLLIANCASTEVSKLDDSQMSAVVTKEIAWSFALQIEFIPKPTISLNQILVEVKAAGINPFDVYIRGESRPKMPTVLGREISGIVSNTNTSIPLFKSGDHVFCALDSGGYAQYAAAHVHDCYPLSEKLSFTQGAVLCHTYFPAYRLLIGKAKLQKGETVLIHGADGDRGLAAIQIAKAAGAYIVATIDNSAFEKIVKDAGADQVIHQRGDDYLKKAVDSLKNTSFDVIYTVRFNTDIANEKLYLNKNGRLVFLISGEHLSNHTEIKDEEGSMIYAVSLIKFTREEQKKAAEFVLKAIEDDFVKPIIIREYRFTEVERAHKEILSSEPKRGKAVFVIDHDFA